MAICNPGTRGGALPANIGVVKSQVLIWDHDPFCARPNQNLSYPLSAAIEGRKVDSNLDFYLDSLTLKGDTAPQNMFVAAVKTTITEKGTGDKKEVTKTQEIDYVRPISPVVKYLPGGHNYNKSEFAHRLWIHTGSLYKNKVVLYPSEYEDVDPKSTQYYTENQNSLNPADLTNIIQSACRWEYRQDTRDGEETFWPYMMSKQPRGTKYPVHWTLEKYAPVWQGCDFHVIVRKSDKSLDFGVDRTTSPEPLECDDKRYHTMMYKKPVGADENWTKLISNTAFHLNDDNYVQADLDTKWEPQARRIFHFGYRPYILVEVGPQHPYHNYVIEIAYGRNPRFLHIGEYHDSAERLNGNGDKPDPSTYKDYQSCRVLGVFEGATSDSLLNQDELTISVRNHLGKLVVFFGGYEDQPWVIEKNEVDRPDDENQSEKVVYDPNLFMVVPASRIRIHGGNISASVNFGFTQYKPSASLTFSGQSIDAKGIDYEDIYATVSSLGTTDPARRDTGVWKNFAASKEQIDRLGPIDFSYQCDAFDVFECLRNKPNTKINLYKYFPARFFSHGKGIRPNLPVYVKGEELPSDITYAICIPEGKGHCIKIYNGLTEASAARPFPLSATGDLGDGQNVVTWTIGISLCAGCIDLDAEFEGSSSVFSFENVLNPILTSWRLQVTSDIKPTEGLEVLDISPLVTSITDSWSADDDSCTFVHDMDLSCYLPKGVAMGYDPGDDPEQTCKDHMDMYKLASELYKLHDRAFYLTVKYWWGHPGVGYQRDPDFTNHLSGHSGSPTCDDTLIQMTGICYGGNFEISNNKVMMRLKVNDYMDVFKKQFMVNSPFFDGCSAHVAIYEIAKMAGFDDCSLRDDRYREYFKKHNVDRRPLGFMQHVISSHASGNIPDDERYTWNGEISKSEFYGLKISYATLSDPAMRFPTGETLDACIKNIAQQDGVYVYFDRYGVLKYESTIGSDIAYLSDSTIRKWYKPKIDFFSSPLVKIPASQDDDGGGFNPDAKSFDPDKAAHLVFNVIRYSRDVESLVNQIVLATAVPEHRTSSGEVVSGYYYLGHCFYDQIFNPNATGFLGFRKPMLVHNGLYGGVQELRRSLEKYARFTIPTSRIEFETFGVPCLKPHDVISLDGNLFYITEIKHDITPDGNQAPMWWMSITGEWMRPYRGDLGLYSPEDEEET